MERLRRARAAVEVDPQIRGGEPVVRGTRIPVYMIANLEKAGETRDRILEDYPAATRTFWRMRSCTHR
jgi:uncharacterized protein (DUF433 family)